MTFVNTRSRLLTGVKVYFPELSTLHWDEAWAADITFWKWFKYKFKPKVLVVKVENK